MAVQMPYNGLKFYNFIKAAYRPYNGRTMAVYRLTLFSQFPEKSEFMYVLKSSYNFLLLLKLFNKTMKYFNRVFRNKILNFGAI